MRVGVVGGTFDPIHNGHIALAEAAFECVPLDLVLLIPVSVPPHRAGPAASAEDRLAMCRLAAARHPNIQVSDMELRRAGPSYTVETLLRLAAERPADRLYLVLGWDAARDLSRWRQPEEVQRLATLVIVSRPGWERPDEAEVDRAGIDLRRAVLCDVRTPDIEATDVRRLLESGRSLGEMLDPAVEAYVRSHGLYRREQRA